MDPAATMPQVWRYKWWCRWWCIIAIGGAIGRGAGAPPPPPAAAAEAAVAVESLPGTNGTALGFVPAFDAIE